MPLGTAPPGLLMAAHRHIGWGFTAVFLRVPFAQQLAAVAFSAERLQAFSSFITSHKEHSFAFGNFPHRRGSPVLALCVTQRAWERSDCEHNATKSSRSCRGKHHPAFCHRFSLRPIDAAAHRARFRCRTRAGSSPCFHFPHRTESVFRLNYISTYIALMSFSAENIA